MIAYNITVNMVRDTKLFDNWELRFELLNEDEMRIVAGWYGIKKQRIEKLINHKSKSFLYMRNRKASIKKILNADHTNSMHDILNKHVEQALKD